ncbi:MFS transporter [Sporolactobacillus shoreicorticis]|uniref:MFS transporter n=1 Tax=Sporolactobacillus shoreicorticis TaxID=1923877 RepID=A0ABW5S206_9BACL|nr:MFS transporter [Sporolactobacillus shoreicorticis]MCO7127523.1 MFS transporter [Sporolactobacillus shoreicorticis]
MLKGNLQKFLFADLISQFGAGMTMSAMTWYVLDMSNSNQLVAVTVNVNIISGLIMAIFAGTIVDYISSKKIIIFSHFLRAMLILIPLLLIALKGYNVFFIFLLALNNGLGWNLYYPASKGLMQAITNKENLLKINSGAEITMQVGLFSAGAIAGVLYKLIGFNMILVFGICIFVASIIVTYLINVDEEKSSFQKSSSFVRLFREGFIFLFSHKRFFLFGIVLYIPFIASNAFNIALPGFVKQVLHSSSTTYGFIDMMYGVGACIAGLIIIKLSKKCSKNVIITICFSIAILSGILFFMNHSIVITIVLTLINGFCGPGIRSIVYSIIMDVVPHSLIGRVMSIWNIVSLVIQSTIAGIIGKFMDIFGSEFGFLIYSFIMILGIIIYYLTRNISKFNLAKINTVKL